MFARKRMLRACVIWSTQRGVFGGSSDGCWGNMRGQELRWQEGREE